MEGAVVRSTLSLIGPGIMLVFGVAFSGAWALERRRPYLLHIATACLLFALGAMCQVLHWPAATGLNAMVSGALYTIAVVLAAQGIMMRSGRAFRWPSGVALVAGVMAMLWYFFYVDRNLLARVYIQNFGYGLILLVAALRLRGLARARPVDRILFWTLLAFALHFFPRTLLTIGFSAPHGLQTFANSVFWQALQFSLAVLGAGLALAIFAAAFSDLLDDLRRDRDFDGLTGVLNRRGFEEAIGGGLRASATPASLVVCDVDHFKRINDTCGHDAGDAVLAGLGRLLREAARTQDVVGRYGGEEFLIFLPGTAEAQAKVLAERLRVEILNRDFPVPSGLSRVTASFGVVERYPAEDWPSLFKRVDRCLYAAKGKGRNRVAGMEELVSASAAVRGHDAGQRKPDDGRDGAAPVFFQAEGNRRRTHDALPDMSGR